MIQIFGNCPASKVIELLHDNYNEDSDNNDVIEGKQLPNLGVDLQNLLKRIRKNYSCFSKATC